MYDPQEIAEVLNDYFLKIGHKIGREVEQEKDNLQNDINFAEEIQEKQYS